MNANAETAHGRRNGAVEKIATGIPGFDLIAEGGLPRARSTLVAGTAGSAKTILSTHFLAAGIERFGEAGVFVTFEDSPADIRKNMVGFGWDIVEWEAAGKWAFVDVSPDPEGPPDVVGQFDLGALLSRIEHAARRIGARRVALDSLSALFTTIADRSMLRAELYRIASALKRNDTTIVLTSERVGDYGDATRWGVEEFVVDNVILLRNILADEKRRRTIEILKFRGAPHQRGEVPFTITEKGIVVIPLTAQELTQRSSTVRIQSGVDELDAMCGGGFFRDSIVLVSGATGTGKTLLVTRFLAGGFANGERCVLFAFEESRDQLIRNAAAFGVDLARMERDGLLRVVNRYPHAMPMEDHLVQMSRIVDEFQPQRVAVDSLSALERVFTLRSFREFVITFTSALKRRGTAGLLTSTTPTLLGGGSITEKHISTLTDSIILLRYVELYGEMRRSITVLKMRGSLHNTEIREFTIDGAGLHIGAPFRGVSGILSGVHTIVSDDDDVADKEGVAGSGMGSGGG